MVKPVFDVSVETMDDYAYQAKHQGRRGQEIIASDFLSNRTRIHDHS